MCHAQRARCPLQPAAAAAGAKNCILNRVRVSHAGAAQQNHVRPCCELVRILCRPPARETSPPNIQTDSGTRAGRVRVVDGSERGWRRKRTLQRRCIIEFNLAEKRHDTAADWPMLPHCECTFFAEWRENKSPRDRIHVQCMCVCVCVRARARA